MKVLSLAYITLFAMAACTPQASIMTTTTAPPPLLTPASYAAGSAPNTTTALDGTSAEYEQGQRSDGIIG